MMSGLFVDEQKPDGDLWFVIQLAVVQNYHAAGRCEGLSWRWVNIVGQQVSAIDEELNP